MSTTPLWVPLVVAGIGFVSAVVGTLGGVLITQRRSDRRETSNWDRQREEERARWAREDAARTFEHRRQAYSDFYESLRAMSLMAYDHGMGLGEARDQELPERWQFPTFQLLQQLKLYATPAVGLKASEAYSAVFLWGHGTKLDGDDDAFYERQEIADEAELALLEAIREDLSIPDE